MDERKPIAIKFMEIDTSGYFRDGRIVLKVVFRDEKGRLYEWVPRWEDVKNLYIEARRVEEINTKTKPVYFNEKKQEVASELAGFLNKFFATISVEKIFGIHGKKDEVIRRVLVNAKNLEEFKTLVERLLEIHNPENSANLELKGPNAPKIMEKGLNEILNKIGLKIKYLGNGRWKIDYKYWIHLLSQE